MEAAGAVGRDEETIGCHGCSDVGAEAIAGACVRGKVETGAEGGEDGSVLDVIEDPPPGGLGHCLSVLLASLPVFFFLFFSSVFYSSSSLTTHCTTRPTMDHHHHHHHQSMDDPNPNFLPQTYPMYANEDDGAYLMYPQQMPPYQVVHPGPPPRQMSESDLHQAMQYQRSLNMMPQYPAPVYTASPPHGVMPLSASPPPQSPNMYDPLSPPVSGSETSASGPYHPSRNSSATGSPSSSRANSLVHRHPLRYNPTPSPTSSSAGRRSRGRSLSDDEDMGGIHSAENLANTRKEATRRQRIEAEQRRRDELRDGYARLKDVLPVSNQKSSKVSLLERACNHITALEKSNRQMQARLAQVESEVGRLRSLNEKISLGVGNTPSPGQVNMDSRPLSPPPEETKVPAQQQQHQLTSVAGQEPLREDSDSPAASEADF